MHVHLSAIATSISQNCPDFIKLLSHVTRPLSSSGSVAISYVGSRLTSGLLYDVMFLHIMTRQR